jgi:hypothetical protein
MMRMRSLSLLALALALTMATAGGTRAGTISVEFPSVASTRTCQGNTLPLGDTGGSRCWTAGEDLVETFTGVLPAGASFTRTRLQFRMDDYTLAPTVNTFDVELNGVVVGSYSTIGNGGNPSLRTLDLTFEHAPIAGPDVTLRIVATSTVEPGLDSWTWFPGGGVTLIPAMDDFSCYGAKDLKNPKFQKIDGVSLEDELSTRDASLKKPLFVCLPVNRDGSGSVQTTAICCYQSKEPKLASKTDLTTGDTLGTLDIRVAKPKMLCLPCQVSPAS